MGNSGGSMFGEWLAEHKLGSNHNWNYGLFRKYFPKVLSYFYPVSNNSLFQYSKAFINN